jgi:imidazole glycerol phosphate synthase subunit HisF
VFTASASGARNKRNVILPVVAKSQLAEGPDKVAEEEHKVCEENRRLQSQQYGGQCVVLAVVQPQLAVAEGTGWDIIGIGRLPVAAHVTCLRDS